MQGSYSSAARAALQQPTWCKLRPEQFSVLADNADASVPENVMFLLNQAAAGSPSQSSSGDSASSSSGSNTSGRSGNSFSSGSDGSAAVPSMAGSVKSSSNAAGGPDSVAQLQQATGGAHSHAVAGQPGQQFAPPPSLVLAGTDGSASRADGWQPQQPL